MLELSKNFPGVMLSDPFIENEVREERQRVGQKGREGGYFFLTYWADTPGLGFYVVSSMLSIDTTLMFVESCVLC